MGEVNDAVVKKTQEILGKIIKKPPLTDKLLARPPFRFLHDIMTSIIRGTGFMKGLFTEEEMNSEAVKEKEQKIAFLQKVIDIVALATGKKLSVKPSKIVAGLDADKTNELLQALAEAVTKSAANNDDLVRQVLGGGGGGASSEVGGSSKSSSAKSKEQSQPAAASSRESSADKGGSNRRSEKDAGGGGGGGAKEQKHSDLAAPAAKDAAPAAKDAAPAAKDAAPAAKDKTEPSRKHGGPPAAEDKAQTSAAAAAASKEDKRESKQQPAARSERGGEEERPQPSQEQRERSSGDDKRRERTKDRDSGGRPREAAEETGSKQQAASAAAPAAAGATDDGDKTLVNGSKEDEDPPANRIPRPSSAKGSRRRHREGKRVARESDEEDDHGGADKRDDNGADEDGDLNAPPASEPRRLVRPSSARPAPPRVKKQEGAAGSAGPERGSLQERVDSGKRVTNLITETGDKSDDDDTFIVQDGVGAQDPGGSAPEAERATRDAAAAGAGADDGSEHGGLVKKILETKKEFEGKQQQQQSSSASTKGDTSTTITEAAMKKERELIQREVDKLRASIQTLTRSANPLGKVMDYVQEDVDAMHKELLSWKKENRELAQQLRREQSVTESSVEPLRVQLGELEQTIADRLDLIAAVKHNIARNDEKVEKMLSTISRT